MFRGITVVAGPDGSGKTGRLLKVYRSVLSADPPGAAIWLAPTHRAALGVRQRILNGRLPGCLNPHCLSFDQFARRTLEASRLRMRPISPFGQRRILKALVGEALRRGELEYFAPIANTSGFLDLLVGLIGELKRLEIWPHELRAARGDSSTPKDRELFHLYDEYQRVLNRHELYDAQGRFWSARAELRKGQPRPFQSVRHVFVDGFVDFTRTEHEILEILAGRVESMTISLPLEVGSRREELFRKPAATLAELRRRHGDLALEEIGRPPTRWPAIDHVERFLFANPWDIDQPPRPEAIEIVPAAGVTHEIELLARRIKALLVQGDAPAGCATVPPGDVLVVFRTLGDEMAQLVGDVFDEYGIPVAIDNRPTLEHAPRIRALVAWLECDQHDWPVRQLSALVVNNFFRPAWPEWRDGQAASAAEYVVRRLQVSSGRAAFLAQLERLATREPNSRGGVASPPTMLEQQSQLAWPLLRRLGQTFDALPQHATASAWASAITDFAREAGLLAVLDSDDDVPPRDRLAWEALVEALGELDRLSGWIEGSPARFSRREFIEQLQEISRSVPLPAAPDESGRVGVLSAENARHLSAPYLFVAGLSERAFPLAEQEDCIFSEAETRELVAAGLPLSPRAQRRGHEMLLFYQVVNRATRRLVLSYPALDDAAQPLSPSPYLSELERTFLPHGVPRNGRPNLSAVPVSDAVFSPRDFRVRAAAQALSGERAMVTRLAACEKTAAVAHSIYAGWEAVAARGLGHSFGPYEGMLTSGAGRALLGQRYGPEHCWSPSQLEQYAACPYQFFLARVLGLEEIVEPVLTVDYAGRGRMLHWLLAMLHRRLNEQFGRHTTPGELLASELAEQVSALAAELLKKQLRDRPLADGLLEIDMRHVSAALVDYHQQHQQYDSLDSEMDQPPRPGHFEVSFGPGHRDDADAAGEGLEPDDPISRDEPFELDCGGQTIRFAGRIDRIDVGQVGGQLVYSIIDYKSGLSESAKAKAIAEGTALQLPLYALAAQELLPGTGATAARIAYWHVSGKGCKENITLSEQVEGQLRASPEWESLSKQLPDRVLSLVRGIRDGQFPMASTDPNCTSRCAYSTVCRVNQARARDKKWQPPGEEPK